MKKIVLIFSVLLLISGIVLTVRFLVGGSEDVWICDNGEWIKHGNPRTSMPSEGCNQRMNIGEENSAQESGSSLVSKSVEQLSQKSIENSAKPEILLLEVPFFAQAPFGQWSDPIYQNACEEASLLMAILWVRGIKNISKEEATLELKKIADFEIEKYNNFYDHSAADTAQIMRDYFNYHNVEIKEDITSEDIVDELLKGNLVIVPINGRRVGNPYYTPPGPLEHMLVIIGYDFHTKEFITNDVGTRHGEKYRYKEDILENALQDYPTGYKESILGINKVMIVVKLPI